MIKDFDGIIISENKYSESSKIINILTKENGIIGVIAKGALKLKSNFSGVTTKFTYAKFHMYYKKDKLSTLIAVDIINPLKKIKKDIIKISYVSFITELTTQAIKHDNDPNIYDIYINSILKIEEGFDPLIITNILELKLLQYIGVKPSIDSCVICGNKTSIITLSSNKGGFLCKKCHTNEKIINEKTIKMIRMMYYVDISKISKLDISDNIKEEINMFLDDYYDRYTGFYLKSKQFLKNIVKL